MHSIMASLGSQTTSFMCSDSSPHRSRVRTEYQGPFRPFGLFTRRRKYASIKGMARVFAIAVVLLLPTALAQDTFKPAAESEIQKLIYSELWGHYELELVSVLKIKDRAAEWGGFQNGYGLKTVTARFVAVRNTEWSENLNRAVACVKRSLSICSASPRGTSLPERSRSTWHLPTTIGKCLAGITETFANSSWQTTSF